MAVIRSFLCGITLLLAALALPVPADVALASDKPKVKISEARVKVNELVDKLSQDAKEHGVQLSTEQKNEMVNDILAKMQAQGAYEFVDP